MSEGYKRYPQKRGGTKNFGADGGEEGAKNFFSIFKKYTPPPHVHSDHSREEHFGLRNSSIKGQM